MATPHASMGRVPRLATSWLHVGAVVLFAALALWAQACAPTRAPAAFGSGLAPVPASRDIARQERAMFERLNRDRAARGLPPLRFDERLSEVARHHSKDMRDHGFFEHESPLTGSVDNRLDAAGYLFLTARENLSEAPDVARSQDGLLDSPPHYANIMAEDVTHVGIGIVAGGVHDARNLTVTQVFARPARPESPEQARARLLERIDRERAGAGRSAVRRAARLMQLAARHLGELDAAGSPESVERAGGAIAAALDGHGGSVLVSAQVVSTSEQLSLPEPLLAARSCAVGVAARKVRGPQGRPALQVLLLVQEQQPKSASR